MHFTILLPTYKTGDMTAYSIRRMLECRGRHTINIIVIDNGNGIGMDELPDDPLVRILPYPTDRLQSHGIAFDFALQTIPDLISECFITVESDSFPMDDRWLDHMEGWANQGWDMVGSKLKLSGGTYIHPAGAMYRKKNWSEAMETVRGYGYHFYETLLPPCFHVMSRDIVDGAEDKKKRFLPIAEGVFHQGMGFNDEALETYGNRNMESEPPTILPRSGNDRYTRMMYEPGQWFAYWHAATGKRIKEVPTKIQWLPNRENQAQEYTLMENGFKHLWGITAYTACENGESVSDVVAFKRRQLAEICKSI